MFKTKDSSSKAKVKAKDIKKIKSHGQGQNQGQEFFQGQWQNYFKANFKDKPKSATTTDKIVGQNYSN